MDNIKIERANLIRKALEEDAAARDITGIAVFGNGGGRARGFLVARQELVISGLDVARDVFLSVSKDTRVVTGYGNGAHVKKGERLAEAAGFVSDLLRAERTALNFLQHLSGIATLTSLFVEKVKPYRCSILDTRKTIPGLRFLEKRAVVDGGGKNHRMNLADQYLIKDNHIDACGGIREAIQRVKFQIPNSKSQTGKLIEVEARNLVEVRQALEEGADIILLDNMKLPQIRKAVKLAHNSEIRAYGGTPLLEVSGGVNLKNVRKIAQTGVSRISIGALTHSAPAVDIAFDIE
ncbi:MAG: carboxylating nicotinate-nucleotide diphosphorylase [Deltaproteobacteria bacterium]|nr:carboxylating nicotinate-nucleotide diphosphorylase [Deltaproteobacteria bacterium]